jgi:phosphopentomutase
MMVNHIRRITLIVLDSVGCGDAPDAAEYGDLGSNTLSNTSRAVGGLNLPHMTELGLGNIVPIVGVPKTKKASGVYGRLTEVSPGKDTTTGHWELSGVIIDHPFPLYPSGFPDELINKFEGLINRKTLGNYPASGTEIIKDLGEKHLQTGNPIVYTSGDSVFQIAAHEDIIAIDELYRICQIARSLLVGEHAVSRVIARPFVGQPGNFIRTERRKDYSLKPPDDTILDVIKNSGMEVMGVGKIEDIFAHRGLTMSNHTGNNMAGVDAIIEYLSLDNEGLIFANLVDFDSQFGHRNNPKGYANALEAFDKRLLEIISCLKKQDMLIITADHGNDPTTPSTDHSRERVPILIIGDAIKQNLNLGTRDSFADVAATIAALLRLNWQGSGNSFANKIVA